MSRYLSVVVSYIVSPICPSQLPILRPKIPGAAPSSALDAPSVAAAATCSGSPPGHRAHGRS